MSGHADAVARTRGGAADVTMLRSLWLRWSGLGHGAAARYWETPTRLPRWRVADLYAHVALGAERTAAGLDAPCDGPAEVADAADYFDRLSGLGAEGARRVADLATAAAPRGPRHLAGAFQAGAARLAEPLADGAVIDTVAGPMRAADFAVTRIVEATVHLLDLASGVPGAPTPEPAELLRTSDVLVALTGPARFVELATGRIHPPVVAPVLT